MKYEFVCPNQYLDGKTVRCFYDSQICPYLFTEQLDECDKLRQEKQGELERALKDV